jgi:hypothetical protein
LDRPSLVSTVCRLVCVLRMALIHLEEGEAASSPGPS